MLPSFSARGDGSERAASVVGVGARAQQLAYESHVHTSADLCGNDRVSRLANFAHWQQASLRPRPDSPTASDINRPQTALFPKTKDLVHGGWIKAFHRRAVDFLLGGRNQVRCPVRCRPGARHGRS